MAEKNMITVTIAGCVNVGKSRVSHLVITALEDAGLDVEISPEVLIDYGTEEKFFAAMDKNWNEAIQAVGSKSKIVVKEVQLHRDPLKT